MATPDDVYRKFGNTAHDAQLLEQGLITLLSFANGLKADWFSEPNPQEAQALIDGLDEKTLGQLVHQFKKDMGIKDDLPRILVLARDTRNRLMHGFFTRGDFRFHSEAGRDAMLAELEQMRIELVSAWHFATKISNALKRGAHATMPPEKLAAAQQRFLQHLTNQLGDQPELIRVLFEYEYGEPPNAPKTDQ